MRENSLDKDTQVTANVDDQMPDSYFAPAGRVSEQVLLHEKSVVAGSEMIATLLNAMPDFLMVLNEKRQIIAVNKRLLRAFGVDNPEMMLGLRPGEAVGCVHANDGPGGCGTSKTARSAAQYWPYWPARTPACRSSANAS